LLLAFLPACIYSSTLTAVLSFHTRRFVSAARRCLEYG
jgi:hypothetical protein